EGEHRLRHVAQLVDDGVARRGQPAHNSQRHEGDQQRPFERHHAIIFAPSVVSGIHVAVPACWRFAIGEIHGACSCNSRSQSRKTRISIKPESLALPTTTGGLPSSEMASCSGYVIV